MQVIPFEQDWQLGIQYAQVSDPVGKYWLGWVLASEQWVKHWVLSAFKERPALQTRHLSFYSQLEQPVRQSSHL